MATKTFTGAGGAIVELDDSAQERHAEQIASGALKPAKAAPKKATKKAGK